MFVALAIKKTQIGMLTENDLIKKSKWEMNHV